MTERVAKLRQSSLDTKPWLSIERARLLTEFYDRQSAPLSVPLMRAYALALHHGASHHRHRPRRADCGGARTRAQGHADVSRAVLPQHGGLSNPRLARENLLLGERGGPAHPAGGNHPLLAGPQHARPHLRGDGACLEGRLRGGHLHRVHGAAVARPHGPGGRDLPQGPRRSENRGGGKPGPPGFLQRSGSLRQAAGAQGHGAWPPTP